MLPLGMTYNDISHTSSFITVTIRP